MTALSRRLPGLVAGTLTLALAATGLATGSSGAGPASAAAAVQAVDPAPPPIPARYLNQDFALTDPCSFDDSVRAQVPTANTTFCTFVVVPMDWKHPDAHPDITLAIAYSEASGPSKGLLTSNPGGPGAEGLDLSAALALGKPQMFGDYDLLGFDPRGFAESQQVVCNIDDNKVARLPRTVDYRSRSKKTHGVEVAEAKYYGKACSSSELSQFINTQQTVYDMDFLRALLNKRVPDRVGAYSTLNYIGYSYGTWLGAWYADTFPTHVGRFILDSNMDWTASMYANQRMDSFSFERRRDSMFYPWVARHNSEYHYGKTAASVKRHYERARAKLVSFARLGYDVPTPLDMDSAIIESMYVDVEFYQGVEFLQQLDDIVASATPANVRRSALALKREIKALSSGPSDGDPEGQIVRCNDTHFSTNIQALIRRGDRDAKTYPFIGYFDTVNMCSYWRFKAQPRTIDLAGVPRMLMIQTEGDPATAYEGALAAHKKTAGHTRLVSVDNEGQHAIYIGGPSRCVERIGDAFLFSGSMPATDLVCTSAPLPDDTRVYSLKGPLNGKRYPLDARQASVPTSPPNPLLAKIRAAAARQAIG